MKFKIFLVAVLAVVLGCSDFMNDSSSNKGGGAPAPEKLGDNSFPEGFNPNQGEFSEYNMLANIGLNVIQPKVKNFRLRAEVLNTTLKEHCASLEQGDQSPSTTRTVKDSWKEAMLAFHRVDSSPLGPQVDRGNFIGDNIYKYPVSSCGIDVEVDRLSREGTPNRQLITNLKGLGALEYLLFESELTSTCPPRYTNVKAWVEKPANLKRIDRCRFALGLGEEIVLRAQELERAWDQEGSNYSKVLVEDRGLYPTMKDAVTAMSDALFAIENAKDERFGFPLGLHANCVKPEGKCPEDVEHPWSGISLEAIEERIRGFQHLFWGANSPDVQSYGFDDYLREMGRGDVANTLTQASREALNAVVAVGSEGTLKEQILAMNPSECRPENTLVPICATFQKLRGISNALKTDFLIALSLRAPPTRKGDMD